MESTQKLCGPERSILVGECGAKIPIGREHSGGLIADGLVLRQGDMSPRHGVHEAPSLTAVHGNLEEVTLHEITGARMTTCKGPQRSAPRISW
jgi:hypothetical protein